MSKITGKGNGVFIKDFISGNLPPMTWNIVAVKVMKLFVKYKLKATAVTGDDEFPEELVMAIDTILKEQYKTELPK